MARSPSGASRRLPLAALLVAVLLAGGIAGWLWGSGNLGSDPAGSLARSDRRAIEQVVRDYILEHPEILPEAMEKLQRRETSKQLAGVRGAVEKPFPGAVLGNPEGKVTLVEFTDFACGYCRQSVADVEALVAENPDLRVVVRELPILSPESAEAAKMALAAAKQGKFEAFHHAMFAAGRPSPQTIEAAARAAGVDLAKARAAMQDPAIEAELERNLDLARQLGFNGTPSWVVGDDVISGAVGKEHLSRAIAAARES